MNWEQLEIAQTLAQSKTKSQYLAVDRVKGQSFFLTVYHLDFISEDYFNYLQSKVESAAKLDHPNIQKVYAYNKQDNAYYVLSEYISGLTLEEYLENNGAAAPDWALQLCQQLGGALQLAHANGITHGRLSSRNVRFTADGQAKILGFDQFSSINYLSSSREELEEDLLYTAFYMAPEVIQEEPVTELSDQYSLACIYFEALTAQILFEASSVQQVLGKKFMRLQGLDRLDSSKQITLMHALQPEASQRYESVAAFMRDLSQANRVKATGYATGAVPVFGAKAVSDESSGPVVGSRPFFQSEPYPFAAQLDVPQQSQEPAKTDTGLRKSLIVIGALLLFALMAVVLINNKKQQREFQQAYENQNNQMRTQFAQNTKDRAEIQTMQARPTATTIPPQNQGSQSGSESAPVFVAPVIEPSNTFTHTHVPTYTSTPEPTALPNVQVGSTCRAYLGGRYICISTWRYFGSQMTVEFESNNVDMNGLYLMIDRYRFNCGTPNYNGKFTCSGSLPSFDKTLVISLVDENTGTKLGSTNYIFRNPSPTNPPQPTKDKYGN